ncbi:MAG: pyridoxamine 5'-phosphate oxidase family protein [Gaiellaceae bacterium]
MFTAAETSALLELLRSQPIAALGTLHQGEPFVSMVPYALVPGLDGFTIQVSTLASHTKDMVDSPAVSMMVTAIAREGDLPQSMLRATFQCQAHRCGEEDPHHEAARNGYLARFPQSEPMFGLGDFSLFVLVPRYMRFVGGFARARTVMAPELATIMAALFAA